jgi:hypothetical protein
MILGFLFFGATTLLGWAAAARLMTARTVLERLAFAGTGALVLQQWLPFALAKLLGLGIERGPALALLFSVAASAFVIWRSKARGSGESLSSIQVAWRDRDRRWTSIFLVGVAAALGYLYWTHSLRPTAEGLSSAGISWEDQSGHAMYASSFLYSQNLDALENPHFAGSPLAYPFLSNLLAASLAKLGMSLSQAFWFSAWYAGVVVVLLIWVIARDWLGSRRAAVCATVFYLLAGGFGFTDFLAYVLSGTPWQEALMKHDYANGWEFKLHYHNPLVAVLLPMRSFCFGMPLALGALLLLWRSLEHSPEPPRFDLLIAGILVGLMPLVNAHTCIITAWCGLGLFFLSSKLDHAFVVRRLVLFFGLPVLLLALPQLLWTRQQMSGTHSFVHPAFGWMADKESFGAWWLYWVQNGGMRIPLGLLGWFVATARVKLLTLPFLGLLFLGNAVAFQPFLYDNVKLFVFADLAIAALTVALFRRILAMGRWSRWLLPPLCLLITASGVLSVWREWKLQAVIVDWEGVKFAELVRQNSAPRALFLTSGELTHPVPVLTGRPLLLGYQGWLTNLGVPVGTRAEDVKEMFAAGPRAEQLLADYRIEYVVIGPAERREFSNLDETFFAQRASQTWTSGPFTLYRISP